MTLKQITVIKTNASYKELKALAELLKSDNIINNGKIVVRCDLECSILEIRKQIKELLDVKYSDLNCVYSN